MEAPIATRFLQRHGSDGQGQWVGPKFVACTWIYTKKVLTSGQQTPEIFEVTLDVHHNMDTLGMCKYFL